MNFTQHYYVCKMCGLRTLLSVNTNLLKKCENCKKVVLLLHCLICATVVFSAFVFGVLLLIYAPETFASGGLFYLLFMNFHYHNCICHTGYISVFALNFGFSMLLSNYLSVIHS